MEAGCRLQQIGAEDVADPIPERYPVGKGVRIGARKLGNLLLHSITTIARRDAI